MTLEEAPETNAPAAPTSGMLTPNTATKEHWTPQTGTPHRNHTHAQTRPQPPPKKKN